MDPVVDLTRQNLFFQLPSLNHIPLDQLKDGIMVKYRGMVQDILNPEYYLAMYEEQHQESGQTVRGNLAFSWSRVQTSPGTNPCFSSCRAERQEC
jgi:hypothetical protein